MLERFRRFRHSKEAERHAVLFSCWPLAPAG